MKTILVCAVAALLSGCVSQQPDYYGTKVSRYDIDAFEIVSYDSGSVTARYGSGSERSVIAFAYIDPLGGVDISVRNQSKFPVDTNYFLDEFYAVTKDGGMMELRKNDILYYPDRVINPGETEEFSLRDTPHLNNTTAIFISLNQDMFILLKPVPRG